jgi:hypothetical protein
MHQKLWFKRVISNYTMRIFNRQSQEAYVHVKTDAGISGARNEHLLEAHAFLTKQSLANVTSKYV